MTSPNPTKLALYSIVIDSNYCVNSQVHKLTTFFETPHPSVSDSLVIFILQDTFLLELYRFVFCPTSMSCRTFFSVFPVITGLFYCFE